MFNPHLTTSLLFFCLFNSACTFEEERKNYFNVNGDIYGLEGELTLNANGSEELIIRSNSDSSSGQKFSLRQRFYSGDTFKVSIAEQPSLQYCRFINNQPPAGEFFSATITNQDFDEININCLNYHHIGSSLESLSADYHHTCLIDNEGAKCLGGDARHTENTNITQITTGLINPRSITSSDTHGCVIDDTGIVCWGREAQASVPPHIVNPREVEAGSWFSCAIDDTGLKCWGWELLTTEIPFDIVNATNLSVGRASACVLDNGKPICRATSKIQIEDVPDILDHVSYMSVYKNTACAIQDHKLYCWGDSASADSYGIKLNNTLSKIRLGYRIYCLANDKTVSCTDQISHELMEDIVKIMPNAKSIELGIKHACATNDEDAICIGNHFAYQ
jgi:hypothetical protein